MQVRDKNRYRMFTTVEAFFESRKDTKTWTTIPALVRAVTDLGTVASEIAAQLEVTASPSGVTSTKAVLLDSLIAAAAEVAAATHAYGIDNENGELAAQVDFSESDLREGREPVIVARCSKVLSLASQQVEELGDYGITPAKLTALGKKIDAFQKACPRPRQNVAARSAARKALPRLFRQARAILTTRMDKLMVQFKHTAPDFFNEYQTVRKVVQHAGALSGSGETAVQPTVTPTTLPKAA